MLKTIKKVVFGSLSILTLSVLCWIILAINPSLSYANNTQIDFVNVYHNEPLHENMDDIILEAISILKTSELYSDDISIELCLNDDDLYPKLNPIGGDPLAYAMLDKTVVKNCRINYEERTVETNWAINNHEFRKFNLPWLLAHEFTHNLQNHDDFGYVFKTTLGNINWKLEGYAEYISRQFKGDGKLTEKLSKFLIEEEKEHVGVPVFEIEDGTKQSFSYFKYAIIVQYLMEEEGLSYKQICEDDRSLDELFNTVKNWSKE